jgi:hypothetical protein
MPRPPLGPGPQRQRARDLEVSQQPLDCGLCDVHDQVDAIRFNFDRYRPPSIGLQARGPGSQMDGEAFLDEPGKLVVNHENASISACSLLERMRSRRPSSQMPPLGTVLRDDAAVEAVTQWLGVRSLFSHPSSNR